jgi:hypothetical protein
MRETLEEIAKKEGIGTYDIPNAGAFEDMDFTSGKYTGED